METKTVERSPRLQLAIIVKALEVKSPVLIIAIQLLDSIIHFGKNDKQDVQDSQKQYAGLIDRRRNRSFSRDRANMCIDRCLIGKAFKSVPSDCGAASDFACSRKVSSFYVS